VVVSAWGGVAVKSNLHSVRKSLLSGLIGIAVEEGKIDLQDTLAEIGIDDRAPKLSQTEKQATVGDLIKARSGIYHPALYETAAMTASKPPRGSHAPGKHWHYNNWDFNALGTIYEQQSGEKIFEAFARRLAAPLGMEDFQVSDGDYVTGSQSDHPAYPFRMTARDLARFGYLYLRQGRWKEARLLSPEWVAESTARHSAAGGLRGYGYMWWTLHRPAEALAQPPSRFFASGWHGQLIWVDPGHDLVVVHRVNTDHEHRAPRRDEFRKLFDMIFDAYQGGGTSCDRGQNAGVKERRSSLNIVAPYTALPYIFAYHGRDSLVRTGRAEGYREPPQTQNTVRLRDTGV